MSGPTRPPSGGAPGQPWTPEPAAKGVTCPACGLANEPGARTCRNCGLPIASADDPVRGVAAGRIDMPSAQRSGLSATVGLVLVVALLLVGGTLAVSGGGILNSGGRLGVDTPTASPEIAATADPDTGVVPVTVDATDDPGSETGGSKGTSFGYTCDADGIRDLSAGKWNMSPFVAGSRDGFDRVTFKLARQGKNKAKNALNVNMEWVPSRDARKLTGAPQRVQGNRAIVLTFDGPATINVPQVLDQLFLEEAGVDQIRNVQMFEGEDGDVRVVIGINSDSCVRMQVKGKAWDKKSKLKNAQVYLDIERFDQ